ncbi:hypothetical protein [Nonomuraea sp. NPDC002799]
MSTPSSEYQSFNAADVQSALDAAKAAYAGVDIHDIDEISLSSMSVLSMAAGCISITVQNNKICVNLPLGLGGLCIPLPLSIPNGTVAQACLRICTIFGAPTGACVSIEVAGVHIAQQCIGLC